MNRRSFLTSLAGAGLAAAAPLPKAKITRVRVYRPQNLNPTLNQSNMLCTVETDIGITGIGEGGTKDLLEHCGGSLIGKNPFEIERIWQHMYIDYFYPPGREKIHAAGGLDMALWDIKGKAFGAPVHQLLGGMARNHVECYGVPRAASSAGQRGGGGFVNESAGPERVRELAQATMEAGFRCFRMDASVGGPIANQVFNTNERGSLVVAACKAAREGVGRKGDWMIDLHQKFDYGDASRICKQIEEYEPFMVEDPVRDEHAHQDLPKLRQITTVKLGHGEEWGQRYDFNKLIESHDVDYARCTLPNVGGITEMLKIMALCETHAVGIVPHFTGPIATAALVHCLGTFSGQTMVEIGSNQVLPPYLPQCHDFKNGRLWPNERPGLGVTVDFNALQMIGEVTQPGMSRIYFRPDGSLTHW
jgi:L-alanine-DL-glutamate epimerase-like enolase superfamily enzyme